MSTTTANITPGPVREIIVKVEAFHINKVRKIRTEARKVVVKS